MAEQDSGQERTEQPTAKRLKQAREQGQRPQSRDLSTLLLMAGGVGGLLFAGGSMMTGLAEVMRQGLIFDRTLILNPDMMAPLLGAAILDGTVVVAPLLVIACVAVLISGAALGGPLWSSQAIAVQWSKLNPGSGLKRIFSAQNLAEFVKSIARFALIAAIAAGVMYLTADEVIGLSREPLSAALPHAGKLLLLVLIALTIGLIVIAAIDVPFQLWTHHKQLRMTRQEIREEMIESEGRPEVRARVRGLQRERARQRMMAEVPRADVVIVNPVHFAVALRFNDGMRAPRVVAKGVDQTALKIREIASAHRVAIFQAPPLARALFVSTRLEQEIPAALYVAVARVLAYVYQLRVAIERDAPSPTPPAELHVPDELAARADAIRRADEIEEI